MIMHDNSYVIGVDAGSASVRAGVFDLSGRRLALAVEPIAIYRPREDSAEQSSENIWAAVCATVRRSMADAGIAPESVAGIGFDATCSLVALDDNDGPVTVSPDGDDKRNIVMWMDHRARAEAETVTRTGNEALRYVGGVMSLEMELPKLLWLRRHCPDSYRRAAKFMDLADWLVYRACGEDVRSACTLACKWTWLAHERRWSADLFRQLGLEDLFQGERLGRRIADVGDKAGETTARAAEELGLRRGTPVAVGIIDAHAGGVGILGEEFEGALAMISGTSTCHMAVSREPVFVPGVWGPYFGAMLPGFWLGEGGQSASGALVDHVIRDSEAGPALEKEAQAAGESVYERLNALAARYAEPDSALDDYHLLGYFHGNRSPRADASLRGMACGLSLNRTPEELARRYLAAIQALGYGTRHIIETMNDAGYAIGKIRLCGGGAKNPLLIQEHADITGCETTVSPEPDAPLLGSAMLAAAAAGCHADVFTAMRAMTRPGKVFAPRAQARSFHDRKYRVFLEMHDDQIKYRRMMAAEGRSEQ